MLRKISILSVLLLLAFPFLFLNGCAKKTTDNANSPSVTTEKSTLHYNGKVMARSNKAQTISLRILQNNRPRLLTIQFDNKTRGTGHAVKGKYIQVIVKKIDGTILATSIKPHYSGLMEGVSEIRLTDVKNKINNRKDFVLIDSRSSEAYMKSHLPTALSLPACSMEAQSNRLPDDKQRLLVFYCDDDTCGSGIRASAIATELGYRKVKVFKAGLRGWSDDNNKTVASDEFVKNGKCVLVDLRSENDFFTKRIPGAVSMPFKNLENRLQTISSFAPVVIYSDSIQESLNALRIFRNNKFSNVSIVEGNLQGWKKRGNATVSGPVTAQKTWKRQLGPGEVSVLDFKRAINGQANAQIIDVRTNKEVKSGTIQGAYHIPLNEITQRMSELNRGTKIYIYCTAGARAKMASSFLREQGFDVYYLQANISCSGGKCTITE